MLLRNAWYIGAWAHELGDKPLARRICVEPVALFRDGSGKAAALADRCCHLAAPLHLGSLSRPASSAAITVSFSTPADAAWQSPGRS
jgi:phenylpropionate dioxygenase-like ring-hydroxylating dioxygenase large terminal subunit